MSSSAPRNSPSPPSYSPITDLTISSPLPNSLPLPDPIPYKTLLNPNIWLGPHDVLETGPPPLPLYARSPIPSSDPSINTVPPSPHELVKKSPTPSSTDTSSATEGIFFFLLI